MEIFLLPVNFGAFVFEKDEVIHSKANNTPGKPTTQNSRLYSSLIVEIETHEDKNQQKQGRLSAAGSCMEPLSTQQIVLGNMCYQRGVGIVQDEFVYIGFARHNSRDSRYKQCLGSQ